MSEDENKWRGEERRGTEGWHLKKEISIGHLITTLTIAFGAVAYIIQNEKFHEQHRMRIDAVQSIVAELRGSDLRQDAKMENAVSRIEAALIRLDDKLDRNFTAARNRANP